MRAFSNQNCDGKSFKINSSKKIAGDFNTDFKQVSGTNSITNLFSQYGLSSTLPTSITTTTERGSYIDNIFTNLECIEAGRYMSFTSDHDPLFLHFKLSP